MSKTEDLKEKPVSREIAESEVNSWLDYKKVGDKKREAYKDKIEYLVDAIEDGTLVLNADKSFTQKLKHPAGENGVIDKLTFAARINASKLHQHLQGTKGTDGDGRILCHICALTGKPKIVIGALDTEDYGLASDIAVFFLS